MKSKIISFLFIAFISFLHSEAKVKLATVLSDGMVLQRDKPIKIWGTADAGERIIIEFRKKQYETTASLNGKWQTELIATKAGGPFEMKVNNLLIKDIFVGDVWLCSGQSNMELTAARVMDRFGDEICTDENEMIRYVKTPYGNNVNKPQDDISPMHWVSLNRKTAPSFSALAYFFAKEMWEETKVPIGIINSSWGGSSIEAWMSEDALQNFSEQLRERDIYKSDEYRKLCNQASSLISKFWSESLYQGDKGLNDSIRWYSPEYVDSNWQEVNVFSTSLGTINNHPIRGSHWFRQEVMLTSEQAVQPAVLRLGCLIDADSVYVNGIFVGTTAYQYPPRIYPIPSSVLKVGKNQITIRLISSERPAFINDKPYCLAWKNDTIHLSAIWKYRTGCEMPPKAPSISFQNVPTGMYNSMINPLRKLSFKGVLWYQGESNTGRPDKYEALLTSMIKDWRDKLENKDLPFFIVQLANFMQTHSQPINSNWAALREAQRKVTLKVPNTALAVAIDLGEWNDIHPLNKKDLAKRIALLAKKMVYGHKNIVYNGPICSSMSVEGTKVILSFKTGTNDLLQVSELKGFAIAGDNGHFYWAKAQIIDGNKVLVWSDKVPRPIKVRYAWDDNPKDANLKNKLGLPASPFEMEKQTRTLP